ncbi:MAG TPA: Wzz/FepE/Etk N-terminal domain-containing protein [Methylocaldum sp.]|nr:Wzz/FepE/Etk N-terminal domain-containing protein [Methylocaldum sp.]
MLAMLLRHKYKALAAFLIALSVGTITALLEKPVYEAHAALLFNLGREYRYIPEFSGAYNSSRREFRMEELLNTETELLNSTDLRQKVITAIGIKSLYPELKNADSRDQAVMDEALLYFDKSLAVKSVKNSGVIHVYFAHTDSAIAKRVVDLLVTNFIEKHVRLYGDSRTPFFEQKVAEYTVGLNEVTHSLQDFKQQYGIVNVDEQIRLLLQRQSVVEETLRLSKSRVNELSHKLASLQKLKNKMPQHGEFAQQRLLELQIKEQDLLKKYNENSRTVAEVRKDIANVKEFLRKDEEEASGRFRRLPNQDYWALELETTHLEPELASAQATIKDAEQTLRQINDQLSVINMHKGELLDLETRLAVKQGLYRDYLSKLEETKISEELDLKKVTNVRVFQESTISPKPLNASKLIKITVGALFGLLAAFSVAYFAEFRRRAFYAPEGAEEKLGVPVLARIPAP